MTARADKRRTRHLHPAGVVAGLVAWLALAFGTGWIAAQFEPGVWYAQLEKPPYTPADWVFPPVWGALYLLMGIAAWLVWYRKGFSHAAFALILFIVQLELNAAWSWLFFGLKLPGVAFAQILILLAAVAATVIAFWRHHRLASALLMPYLVWTGFAAVLNFEIWRLNAVPVSATHFEEASQPVRG